MRKGSKRNDWTVSEIAYLVNNAGKISKRDICKKLRRSSKSVERKAAWLRSKGHSISLRHYTPQVDTCPSCGNLSATIGRNGFCGVCQRREQLATIHARIAELLPLLPVEERDTYSETEAETESTLYAKPKAPNTTGMSSYHKAKAEEEYAIALEAWTARNLFRQIKAAQKRKERIEKKVKSMGVCIKPQVGGKNKCVLRS